MNSQTIISVYDGYEELYKYLKENRYIKVMLVMPEYARSTDIGRYFCQLSHNGELEITIFDEFEPNPCYESVVRGVNAFKSNNCNGIIALGGGSAIDVAKCIKIFSTMNPLQNYLEQEIIENDIPFLAIPTTAGTGSESTKYAVIYDKGVKQSISHECCVPSAIILDKRLLLSLPDYQRKATMLDALCHGIESYWSLHSTEESRKYSRIAIEMILANVDAYMANNEIGNANMLMAANYAGRAINIAQTTAGHALCYKLTTLYKIAHGHAAALCVSNLFPLMAEKIQKCIEPRGIEFLKNTFEEIASAMGCDTVNKAIEKLNSILEEFNFYTIKIPEQDYEELVNSVNTTRLKNNPIALDKADILYLYHQITKKDGKRIC